VAVAPPVLTVAKAAPRPHDVHRALPGSKGKAAFTFALTPNVISPGLPAPSTEGRRSGWLRRARLLRRARSRRLAAKAKRRSEVRPAPLRTGTAVSLVILHR
jgi:hypothetical protein